MRRFATSGITSGTRFASGGIRRLEMPFDNRGDFICGTKRAGDRDRACLGLEQHVRRRKPVGAHYVHAAQRALFDHATSAHKA